MLITTEDVSLITTCDELCLIIFNDIKFGSKLRQVNGFSLFSGLLPPDKTDDHDITELVPSNIIHQTNSSYILNYDDNDEFDQTQQQRISNF